MEISCAISYICAYFSCQPRQTERRMVKWERERKRSNSSSLETTLWKSLKKGHQLRISVAVEASSSGRSGFEDVVGSGSGIGARERRRHKMREERKRRQEEEAGKYPEWATILENACKDDAELRDIIGDALGDPEEMKRRVEERVRRKGRDILQPKTGSAIPMAVSFRDFDPTDSYIWLELYSAPSEKDIEIIGSVVRSWYVLGRLGGFNSMNMQLTQLPLNAKLSYSPEKAEEALPSVFHNIGDVEFQEHWARVWVDLGTSDPVALDVIINSFAAVSSDHVGIKRMVFGGNRLGDWDNDLTGEEDGYKSYKI
ncbi:unnamed protein product [Sphagnum jensenii]|uniref:Uncharacterized protein n=1 Tax=Sphagnum jensenii TaxID=128206 RepID=A0ABP1BM91_9BRYO